MPPYRRKQPPTDNGSPPLPLFCHRAMAEEKKCMKRGGERPIPPLHIRYPIQRERRDAWRRKKALSWLPTFPPPLFCFLSFVAAAAAEMEARIKKEHHIPSFPQPKSRKRGFYSIMLTLLLPRKGGNCVFSSGERGERQKKPPPPPSPE